MTKWTCNILCSGASGVVFHKSWLRRSRIFIVNRVPSPRLFDSFWVVYLRCRMIFAINMWPLRGLLYNTTPDTPVDTIARKHGVRGRGEKNIPAGNGFIYFHATVSENIYWLFRKR